MEFLRTCTARLSRLFHTSNRLESDARLLQQLSSSTGKPSSAATAVAGIARCISAAPDILAAKLLSLVEPLLEVLQLSSSSKEGCNTACLQHSTAAVCTTDVAATAVHLLYRIACTAEGRELLGQQLDLLLQVCTDNITMACPQVATYLGNTLTAVLNCKASQQQLTQRHLQLLLQAALEPPAVAVVAHCDCSSCRGSSCSNISSSAALQDGTAACVRHSSRANSSSSSSLQSTAVSVLNALTQQDQVLQQLLQQLPELLDHASTTSHAAGVVFDLLQTLLHHASTSEQPVLQENAGAVAQCVLKLYQVADWLQTSQQQQAYQTTARSPQQQGVHHQTATSAECDEVSLADVEEVLEGAASALVNLLSLREVRQHLMQQYHQQQHRPINSAAAAAVQTMAQHGCTETALASAVDSLLQTMHYFQLRQAAGRSLFASAAGVLALMSGMQEGAAMLSAPQRLQQLLAVVGVELQQPEQYIPWWHARCEFFLDLVQVQVSYGAKHGSVPAFLPKQLADWLQQHLRTAQQQHAQEQQTAQHNAQNVAYHPHGIQFEQQLQLFLDHTLQAAKQQQQQQDVDSGSDSRSQMSIKDLQSLLDGFVFDVDEVDELEGSGVEYEAPADPTLDVRYNQQQQHLSAAAVTARLALLIDCMFPLATFQQGLMMLVPYGPLLQATAGTLQQLGNGRASSSAAAAAAANLDHRHPVISDDVEVAAAAAAACAAAKARQMAAAALAAVQQLQFEYNIACDDLRDATLSMVRCYFEYTAAVRTLAKSKKERQDRPPCTSGHQLLQQQQQQGEGEEEQAQAEMKLQLRYSFNALNTSLEDLAVAGRGALELEQLLQLTKPSGVFTSLLHEQEKQQQQQQMKQQ